MCIPRTRRRRRPGGERGIALLVVIMVLAVLSIISLCSINRLLAAATMSDDHVAYMQAYWTAASARAAALYYLQDNPGADAYSSGLQDLEDADGVLRGQYSYTISEVEGGGTPVKSGDVTAYYPSEAGSRAVWQSLVYTRKDDPTPGTKFAVKSERKG